jgi:bifunctional polynucleotide phosphatase/kinase
MADYCQLISASSGDTIQLKHNQPTVLGRGTLTGLPDQQSFCIEHVQVTANFTTKELIVKQICSHSSKAGSNELKQNDSCILGPGAKLQLTSMDAVCSYNLFFGKTAPVIDYTCNWESMESQLIMEYGPQSPSPLIAAFDLDGTLIKTRSGALPFLSPPDDWIHWNSCVPHKIQAVSLSGYRVVIFTNQGGIPYNNPPLDHFKIKVESVMKSFGDISIILFASINDDEFRKPLSGMWEYFLHSKNNNLINAHDSYYIGDAAGRIANWKKGMKKDFSCADRKFASNISLPFHTPEEYFLGEMASPRFEWDAFNPHLYPIIDQDPVLEPPSASIISKSQEIVVFTGCPASGKTHFYHKYMKKKNYHHVNRDKLGSWEKCVRQCEVIVKNGQSAVIDNTNPDIESRARYVRIARQHNIDVRCVWFITSMEHSLHNNRFREITTDNPDYVTVPRSAFKMYQSKFVQPSLREGFKEIIKVQISLNFTNDKLKDSYMKFLD